MTEPLTDCIDPLHFRVTADGGIEPQPWMQWRQVRRVEAGSKAGSYTVTMTSGGIGTIDVFGTLASLFGSLFEFIPVFFGPSSILGGLVGTVSAEGNKNDLLHSLQTTYLNDTPVAQDVYGLITRGSARVTLQARSRGGLLVRSGLKKHASDPGPLTDSSMFGCGADMGRGGSLALGTSFGMIEQRQPSVTFPLVPERAGKLRLAPGESATAKAEVRFVSELWENTTIDGGDSGAESSYETGGTRLDLFAVPVI